MRPYVSRPSFPLLTDITHISHLNVLNHHFAQQAVATLRAAGAIIITKTNVPQTLLAFESSNPIWGRTLSPWSVAHTAGGSSGGEGALLATDGAALGIGTDVGGSIRIPSGYCGIYGLKPGHGRVSYHGSKGVFALVFVFLDFNLARPEPRFRGRPCSSRANGSLGRRPRAHVARSVWKER